MIKKILLLLLIISPAELLAQAEMEDVIYLKNGSILRGEIIEIKANETVTIEIIGRNILVISMEEVEAIKKEQKPLKQFYKTKGYVNFTGVEILPGVELLSENKNVTLIRYQTVNGYQFSPIFSAGIGLGYVAYSDPLDALPVFLDLRINYKESNNTPFLFLKAGYNFSIASNEDWVVEEHSGGLMLNMGFGLQFYTSENIGMYLTAGYGSDRLSYVESGWGGRTVETQLIYRRLNFGFGLSF